MPNIILCIHVFISFEIINQQDVTPNVTYLDRAILK